MMKGFQTKIIHDNNIKINVENEVQCYSRYSYENKQNRPIKIMAIDLHHACHPNEITKEMRTRGYKLLEVTRKLKYKTKEPMNMFMLSSRNDEDINKIFNITDIICIRV